MIDYIVTVVTLTLLFAIVSLALNVRWGWAGEFDFFVYGLLAMGAYVYGVVTLPSPPPNDPGFVYILGLHQPFVVGAAAAVAVTGVLSLLVGIIALRDLRQVFFGIMTFSSVLVISAVISEETGIFNGFTGLFSVPPPLAGTLHLSGVAYSYFYLGLAAVSLVAVYFVLERLFRSPFGLALRAIREDEVAAAAFGMSPFVLRLKAYVIGGMVAGYCGALLVGYISAWNPDAWSPIETVLIFACIIIGGTGNNRGAILGTFVVFGVILEGTRFLPGIPGHPGADAALRAIGIAVIMLAFLRWRPEGILPETHLRSKGNAS